MIKSLTRNKREYTVVGEEIKQIKKGSEWSLLSHCLFTALLLSFHSSEPETLEKYKKEGCMQLVYPLLIYFMNY